MSIPEPESRRIGPFLIEEEIGVGGMGVVYRAKYEKNGRTVAVKILSPEFSDHDGVNKRFVRETDILKKLQHPNIIKYFGAGSSRMQKFYAMELVEGGALDSILKQKGKLEWEVVVEYGLQIAKALEYAHNAGIVHRDLKPGNLLIGKDGTLKLSDFGIARDTQATALTQAGKTVGTMNYMAPEQISGKHQITRKTDIYAMGCVMFQMLTGEVPFSGANQAEVLFKHLDEEPPSVRDFNQTIPLWLARLIDEMLAKNPEDRPFDALAIQVKLQEVKDKVKAQETKLFQSNEKGGSELTRAYDNQTISVKKKKKRKKETELTSPFWEKSWFLGAVLAVILLIVSGLIMRSRSEGVLYAKAQEYMQNSDESTWIHAEPSLQTLLARYPKGTHATQATEWLDQIGMYKAERAIEFNIRYDREPKSEAERLYVEAQQFEKFGDRMTALQKYEAMPSVIEKNDENRPFLNLSRRQANKIKAVVGSDTDRTKFITDQLQKADELFLTGEVLLARQKWQAIIKLYGNNSEFDVFTEQARTKLLAASE